MSKVISLGAAFAAALLQSGCASTDSGDNSGMQLFQQVIGVASMAVGTMTKNENLTNQGQSLLNQSMNSTPSSPPPAADSPPAAIPAAGTDTTTAMANPNQAVFRVKSNHPNTVHVAYYSQTRRGYSWPGGNQAWVLKDSDWHTHTLNCTVGEQICYGAWVVNQSNTYWGSGLNGKQSCPNCCITCGATLSRELNP
jgi:hypothetical protein